MCRILPAALSSASTRMLTSIGVFGSMRCRSAQQPGRGAFSVHARRRHHAVALSGSLTIEIDVVGAQALLRGGEKRPRWDARRESARGSRLLGEMRTSDSSTDCLIKAGELSAVICMVSGFSRMPVFVASTTCAGGELPSGWPRYRRWRRRRARLVASDFLERFADHDFIVVDRAARGETKKQAEQAQ